MNENGLQFSFHQVLVSSLSWPLVIALVGPHKFWSVVFSLSFISEYFQISPWISSLTYASLGGILFNLWTSGFYNYLCVTDFRLIALQSENIVCVLIHLDMYWNLLHGPAAAHFVNALCTCKECISSVQSLSRVRLFATPWIAACQASLSTTNSRGSLRLMSTESVMPSSHLILCCPLLLLPPSPPSIRVFSNQSILRMRWPKYWSFSFSIIPSKEHPGLISFRMDWLDLLAGEASGIRSPCTTNRE